MMLIEPPSTSHVPDGLRIDARRAGLTSTLKCTCGFCHFHSVTTPLILDVLLHVEHRERVVGGDGDTDASANADHGEPDRDLLVMPNLHSDA